MIRIGLNETAVHRHVLALHQPRGHAPGNDLLQQLLKHAMFTHNPSRTEPITSLTKQVGRTIMANVSRGHFAPGKPTTFTGGLSSRNRFLRERFGTSLPW